MLTHNFIGKEVVQKQIMKPSELRSKKKNIFSGKKIAYPAIGADLGGSNWQIISKIINEELVGEDHTFVEYQMNQNRTKK